jgi:hypothetical protein
MPSRINFILPETPLHKKLLFAAVALLMVSFAAAQEGIRIVRPPVAPKPEAFKPTATDLELKKYGRDLLEITEADAGALQGGMRAWALWQIARGYQPTDKQKALELLENALPALREVEDDRLHTRARLQEQILNAMVPLAPGRADELVANLDADARPKVLSALLRYYQDNKKTDRAIQAIYRIGTENEIPYETAAQLMATMTKEQSGEFLRMFTTSLNSYRDHASDDRRMQMGSGFPEMIVQFWRQLPKDLVRQSIDEVLKQTDPANAKETRAVTFSMASDKGTVTFASAYQYQLFQFLPILEEIDSSAAGQYLKKYRELAAQLASYPEGTNSLLATPSGTATQKLKLGAGVTYSVTRNPQANDPYVADMQLVQKLTAEAESGHAQDAVANVPTIKTPNLRGAAYHNIARATMKDHPTIARECMSKMLDIGDKLPPMFKLMGLRAVIDMYMQMGDFDSAKSLIERAMSVANEVYHDDANPDDPNKALKAYWPATDGYRALLRQAGKISPPWAISLLNDIKDPEIKVAAEAAIAGVWLRVPMGQSVTMVDKKSNHGTMVGGVEAE